MMPFADERCVCEHTSADHDLPGCFECSCPAFHLDEEDFLS